jgi:hypothetical protein
MGILFAATVFAALPTMRAQSKSKGSNKMSQFPPHPGTIRMIDEFDSSVSISKAEDTPERHRFVYLDDHGREVDSADEAAERIPIVEVRMTPTDGKGNLVPKDRAQLIRITEFGPEGRRLRTTTMTPNKARNPK